MVFVKLCKKHQKELKRQHILSHKHDLITIQHDLSMIQACIKFSKHFYKEPKRAYKEDKHILNASYKELQKGSKFTPL